MYPLTRQKKATRGKRAAGTTVKLIGGNMDSLAGFSSEVKDSAKRTITNLANIPQELKDHAQWVLMRYGKLKANGKREKLPIDAKTGRAASTIDPATWSTYTEALAAYNKGSYDGIGYVLTQDDGYTFIDIDDCIRNGELDAGAMATIKRFASYTERSISGAGVHIVIKGQADNRKNDVAEVYSDRRFIVMTGEIVAEQRTIQSCQDLLDTWHAETFPPKPAKGNAEKTPKPVDSAALPADDGALLKIIQASKGAEKFSRLWTGDTGGYINPKTGKTDPSRSDAALCTILAFWTNSDPARMDRLFRQSGLMRAKWDRTGDGATKRTYGQLTIDNAIGQVTRHYSPSKPQSEVALLVDANRAILANLAMRSATQRVILAILSYAKRENKATLPISSRYIADMTGLSHRSAQMEMRLLCPQTRQARINRLSKDIEKAQQRLAQVLTVTNAQEALRMLPAYVQASIKAKRSAQGDAAVMAECVIYLQNKITRIETEFNFYAKNEAHGNTFDLLTCNKTSDGSALANVYTLGTLQDVSIEGLATVGGGQPQSTVTIGHYGNNLQSSRDELQFIEVNMRDDAFVKAPPVKTDPRIKLAAEKGASDKQLDRLVALLAPDEKLRPFGLSSPRVLAYLDTHPNADIEAIVSGTNLAERTVRTVLKSTGAELVEKGYSPLVEIIRQGRKLTYSLADDWRDRLDALRNDLSTNGLVVARTIKHAGDRIRMIERFLAKNQAAPRKRLNATTKAQYEAIRDRAILLQRRLSGDTLLSPVELGMIASQMTKIDSVLITDKLLGEIVAEKRVNEHADFNAWIAERLAVQKEVETVTIVASRFYQAFDAAWQERIRLKMQGVSAVVAPQGNGYVVKLGVA